MSKQKEIKQYLISEGMLAQLLYSDYKLSLLEEDGVDNWWGYMEGRTEFISECMLNFPAYADLSDEERIKMIEDGYDIESLVEDELETKWTPHEEKCGRECQFKFKERK